MTTSRGPETSGGLDGLKLKPSDGEWRLQLQRSLGYTLRESRLLQYCSHLTLYKPYSYRLIVQTFVLDVKNALLFGGEPTMTFLDMVNLRLPVDVDEAWYAQTSGEWEAARAGVELTTRPRPFVEMLKAFWQPSLVDPCSNGRVSGSITLMYGILSVAREVTRREDSIISRRPTYNPSSLANTVERSLAAWEQAWRSAVVDCQLPWMVPTCTCVLQLARSTLYEISPVDLQVLAGKDEIEGKRKLPADYANARRKVRMWAKGERGLRGVSRMLFSHLLFI